MDEDICGEGTSAHTSAHTTSHMSARIEIVGGRRRWTVDQKLAILRDAFGSNGSVGEACKRHVIGSGQIYTWRRQAMSGELMGKKPAALPSFAEVEISAPVIPVPSVPPACGQIGIELPSGVRLTVDAAVDAEALARVMAVLAR